jgi:hypothetical protein
MSLSRRHTLLGLTFLGASLCAFSQTPAPAAKKGPAGPRVTRPPLFLREDWKQIPGGGEHGLTQAYVANPDLELKLYGEDGKNMQATGADGDENNPTHAWTGLCEKPCALALRDKKNFADLSGLARIRWVTKMSGFHQIRPIVKLADGTWLVGDRADGSVTDWLESDISLAEVRWLKLDIEKVVTKGTWVERPDLSKVDEIGFADLMPSRGHGDGGWADVARIEVYAKPVGR